MRIVLVNSQDLGGGAAGFTRQLAGGLIKRGHQVALLVGIKRTTLDWVHEIPVSGGGGMQEKLVRSAVGRFWPGKPDSARVQYLTRRLLHSKVLSGTIARRLGYEDFNLPGTKAAFDNLPFEPEVVHLNNLHDFVGATHFNLEALPDIARGRGLVYTLHDTWAFTGHCVYFFSCQRWRDKCGKCPHLDVPVALRRDRSAAVLSSKAEVYKKVGLTLTAPSSWMLTCAQRSILAPAIRKSAVVPYGIDLEFFCPPDDREEVRKALGLLPVEKVLCFVADKGRQTPWRDFGFAEKLARLYSEANPEERLVLLEVGSSVRDETVGMVRLVGTGPLSAEGVRRVFQAADVMVYPAKVDNFPYVILEALACGTPVVTSRVGGIPEEIVEGENGMLFEAGDLAGAMRCLSEILQSPERRSRMSAAARLHAVRSYELDRMVADYVAIYESSLARR